MNHGIKVLLLSFCLVTGGGLTSALAVDTGRNHSSKGTRTGDIAEAARLYHTATGMLVSARLLNGREAEQKLKAAIEMLYQSAQMNFAPAQYSLGSCYDQGFGVKPDPAEAVVWWRKAAELGHADAQYNLALCYARGKGVAKDGAAAEYWCRKTVAQGHHGAESLEGEIASVKMADAMDSLRQRAEQGDAAAQFELASRYAEGRNIERDEAQAELWYRRAAASGHAEAKAKIEKVDASRALAELHKRAEKGDAQAQYDLGYHYYREKGHAYEAFSWWKKAAEGGHVDGQINLAWCYETAMGCSKNLEDAKKWYDKAARQGSATAKERLKKLEDAEHLAKLRELASQGGAQAQYDLGYCYFNGQHTDRNYRQAVLWWKKAAEQGHEFAQVNLAWCYETGTGVDANRREARKWYQRAAARGNSDAKKALKDRM